MILLGTAFVVGELQLVCVPGLVIFPVVGPAVPDADVVLVLVVLYVHQDGQRLAYLDDFADGRRLQ